MTPGSESAPRTCLLYSTPTNSISVYHCLTRRVYKKDTCLHLELRLSRKRTLINTNESSDPPYKGELRASYPQRPVVSAISGGRSSNGARYEVFFRSTSCPQRPDVGDTLLDPASCSAIARFSTSSSANTKPVTAQSPQGTSSHPMLCSLSQISCAAARLDSLRAYSREHPKTAIVALPTRRRRRPAGLAFGRGPATKRPSPCNRRLAPRRGIGVTLATHLATPPGRPMRAGRVRPRPPGG